MSRTVHVDAAAVLASDNIPLLVMAELLPESGPIRVHSGVGDLVYNGNTFLGAGEFGRISDLQESTETDAQGMVMELSGVNPALVSSSLNDEFQGRKARIWIAVLDADHQVVGDPIGPWTFIMDAPDSEVGETAVLRLGLENRMADWRRPRVRRYTDADQQQEYPGDRFFEFVGESVEYEIIWGPLPTD